MKDFVKRIPAWLRAVQYELAIYILLMLRVLSNVDCSSVWGWQGVSYAVSYKYGFSSRFLIGSLLSIFYPDFVPGAAAGALVGAVTALDCLLTALVLGRILRKASERGQLLAAAIPAAVYIALPTNMSGYFVIGFFGKLECFLFPLMLLAAVILLKTEPGWKQYAAVGTISVVGLLIYQNYLFLCFPLVLALMVYNLFEREWKKEHIIGYLSVCAVSGAVFLYLQLFSKVSFADAETMAAELQQRTDIEIVKDAVFYEYFSSFRQFFDDLMLHRFGYQIKLMIFDLIVLSPAVFMYIYIWRRALRNCVSKKDRWLLIALQLCSAAFLPTYIITCDWARWTVWLFTYQAALLLILWLKDFAPMVSALQSFASLGRRYSALGIAVLVFFLSLSLRSVAEMLWMSKTMYNYWVWLWN